MSKIYKDIFISHLIGYQSYIINNTLNLDQIKKLKKPFFVTLKTQSTKKLTQKIIDSIKFANLKIKLVSKMAIFERKYEENKKVFLDCRVAKKKIYLN